MLARRPRFLRLSVAAILMVFASIVVSATFFASASFADGVVLSDENDDSRIDCIALIEERC